MEMLLKNSKKHEEDTDLRQLNTNNTAVFLAVLVFVYYIRAHLKTMWEFNLSSFRLMLCRIVNMHIISSSNGFDCLAVN